MGNRLVVQFARGNRPKEMMPHYQERAPPRTRRTQFRMSITGLPPETSWQVLHNFHKAFGICDYAYRSIGSQRLYASGWA